MGIPTFFRSILSKDARVIQGASKQCIPVDYFFMDFNSMIYNAWHEVSKSGGTEQGLIEAVVTKTRHLIKEVVCPKGYTYISIDGTAPRAKMVQQRSRRYKSCQLNQYLGTNKGFDPSANIAPGTVFMSRLSEALKKMMGKGDCGTVYLNDASIPGEGEHKFLPRVRNMAMKQGEEDKNVVIFSPDGDMISLSLLTHKRNIFLMRVPDARSEMEKEFAETYSYIYCNLDRVRQLFYQDMTRLYKDSHVDKMRILNDYNFLLSMVGNDFVPSLHFLKIRSGGLKKLIDIYNHVRKTKPGYLVSLDTPTIHLEFFQEIILGLARCEEEEMKKMGYIIQRERQGNMGGRRADEESSMTPDEVFASRLQHLPLCNPHNPLYDKYQKDFDVISYSVPKNEWKYKYYQYFAGVDKDTYNEVRTQMVHNYLESLMFTLSYYQKGCPSWTWYYKYRVAPIPSDIYTVLTHHQFDPNRIVFSQGNPYTPFQQLMFILPPQMSHLLPPPLGQCMKEHPEYYPTDFRVDAVAGMKYIYSEALLPEMDTQSLLAYIMPVEKTLNMEQNHLRSRLWVKK